MQLLYPKPLSSSSAGTGGVGEGVMGNHIMLTGNQTFNKFNSQQLQAGYNVPVFTHRVHMMFGGRSRRRRSNHSLVTTMDPAAVARRNERERNRVKQVNDGFDALRKRVPFLPDKKKLSKVEILRCAMIYMRDLKDIVDEYDHNNTTNPKTRNNSEGSSSNEMTDDLLIDDSVASDDYMDGNS